MKYLLTSILILAVLIGCNNSNAGKSTVSTIDQPATAQVAAPAVPTLPSFLIVNASNQVIDLSQFKGKKVFVNLWATWCPPCRAEIPSIEKLSAKTDNNKAVFVMISLDDNFDKAKSFAIKNNMSLPVYFPAANLPQLFNVQGIPATFIFNENGELVHRQDGSTDFDTKAFFDILNR
jgi:thiol-disulfide isomerase/thioredoxin